MQPYVKKVNYYESYYICGLLLTEMMYAVYDCYVHGCNLM